MTSRRILFVSLIVALGLQACDKLGTRAAAPLPPPPPASAPPPQTALITAPTGPVTERAGPFVWNQETVNFEYKGKPLLVGHQWVFTSAHNKFVVSSALTGPADGSGLAVTEVQPDVAMRSPGGLDLDGGKFPLVLVRLTRIKAGTLWDGAVHYSTPKHPELEGYLAKAPKGADPAVNETVTIIYDMAKLRRGGDDWKASKIDQIRLDLDDAAGGAFVIHQIAVVERPAGYP